MVDIEAAWDEFIEFGDIDTTDLGDRKLSSRDEVPKASDIYISTKTKIVYLNNMIDLNEMFWKLKIMPYDEHDQGIIKKQIKVISQSSEELACIKSKLSTYKYYNEFVITHLDQTQSDENIYKDVRKLTIGISQKDLLSYRSKQKSAFYNCFVIIIRLLDDQNDTFREIHAKVFNTGKIEIPGVQNDAIFQRACDYVLRLVNEYGTLKYSIDHAKTETILINSNFQCGFCINRQALFSILRKKYNLNVSFDPCSYPGIQCKYEIDNSKVSFMIFRTGSVLIVGKCEEDIIYKVYNYLKNILYDEYSNICESYDTPMKKKEKTAKSRKQIIYLTIDSKN
jgi:TATA-box binding protein (TBP) (component of TFIID and TFIIIB)